MYKEILIENKMTKYKLTHEFLYIILDLAGVGPIDNKDQLIINIAFGHHYSKLYRVNGEILCFRDLWTISQTVNLNIDEFIYLDQIYKVINGYVDFNLPDNILPQLLYRINDTGSTLGDEEIIRNIYNQFMISSSKS